jgi:hypothetical protein
VVREKAIRDVFFRYRRLEAAIYDVKENRHRDDDSMTDAA